MKNDKVKSIYKGIGPILWDGASSINIRDDDAIQSYKLVNEEWKFEEKHTIETTSSLVADFLNNRIAITKDENKLQVLIYSFHSKSFSQCEPVEGDGQFAVRTNFAGDKIVTITQKFIFIFVANTGKLIRTVTIDQPIGWSEVIDSTLLTIHLSKNENEPNAQLVINEMDLKILQMKAISTIKLTLKNERVTLTGRDGRRQITAARIGTKLLVLASQILESTNTHIYICDIPTGTLQRTISLDVHHGRWYLGNPPLAGSYPNAILAWPDRGDVNL